MGRHSAIVDSDVVVFILGVRLNHPLSLFAFLKIAVAARRMFRGLAAAPDTGLLAYRPIYCSGLGYISYWRSRAALHQFAHAPGGRHRQAWRDFVRRQGKSGGVGIWHESFAVARDAVESVYVNMPRAGLGAFCRVSHL